MMDSTTVAPGFPGYPDLLASIPDAPKELHVFGALSSGGALALVGSRRPTPYGRRVARSLAAAAARAGIVTVSGMARGIDTEVHRATLDAGGITWAVLGSGLGRLYPPENGGLAEDIVAGGGAVVSEFPKDESPQPWNFPRRNRIISGLSWATVVVEGDARSGALITAKCALEQGRDVFAVPGPVDSPLSEGPHALIRDGARILERFEDILEESAPLGAFRAQAPDKLSPTQEEQKILQLIGSEAVSLEKLLQGTGWDVRTLSRVLMQMEVAGLVASCPGQHYAKA